MCESIDASWLASSVTSTGIFGATHKAEIAENAGSTQTFPANKWREWLIQFIRTDKMPLFERDSDKKMRKHFPAV